MKPGVYMVGTPIGNMQDISARALETLRSADYVMAEDTRHTGRLLAHFGIKVRLVSCHRFNESSRTHFAVRQVGSGKTVALVTSAGMPAVSDPGARMALACRQSGTPVFVVPGPSSVTAALALSGFGGGGYVMQGFLPRKSGARRRQLQTVLALQMPVVVFESPYRLLKLLDDLGALAPARWVCATRELTKLNEECLWGTAPQLYGIFAARQGGGRLKGEFVVVIAPDSNSGAKRQAGGP